VPDKAFTQGDIIIATNLGGRGTDFKVLNTILHVILTFYPATLRTEEQALGRTSRCGNGGTGQLILNIDELAHEYGTDFTQDIKWLKEIREAKEQGNIDDFINDSLPNQMLGKQLI
jgi:preprotein translocase subunit SecA